ncbi:MAG: DMT family transporter [bacterium]|nr:DMT family transporter [bacterium]
MKKNKSARGIIFALMALFLWGIHGPAGRYLALQNVNMYFVASLRFLIGTAVFFLFLLIKRRISFDLKEQLKLVLIISLVGVAGNSVLYHLTLKYLSGTLVMILENLSPIFVLLLVLILDKEKPKAAEIISLILSLSGIIIIVMGKERFFDLRSNFYLGIMLGVLTGITFGFYVYFSSKLVRPLQGDPVKIISYLFKIFLITSVLMSPLLFTPGEKPGSFAEWFWLVEMGVFQSGIAYIFWNYALSMLPVGSASILFLLTIIFTTINEILFLNLRLNVFLIIGGSLIILAGYIISKNLNK